MKKGNHRWTQMDTDASDGMIQGNATDGATSRGLNQLRRLPVDWKVGPFFATGKCAD